MGVVTGSGLFATHMGTRVLGTKRLVMGGGVDRPLRHPRAVLRFHGEGGGGIEGEGIGGELSGRGEDNDHVRFLFKGREKGHTLLILSYPCWDTLSQVLSERITEQ